MKTPIAYFEFTYNLAVIKVEKKTENGLEFYTLHFSNEVPSLTLQAFKLPDGSYRWDSVSTGNLEMANSLGKLIEHYNLEHKEDEINIE